MTLTESVKKCFTHYVDFKGRASRSEYWYFVLACFILALIFLAIGSDILSNIVTILIFLPNLAVQFRRLHDTGRSGFWVLINLIPFIGFIVILVMTIQKGTPGENKYGADPLELEKEQIL